MVTAADGAASYYTLENNAVRSESAQEAREVDKKTQKAWLGHAHHYVFDNSTDFEGKLQRVVNRISKLVGLPHNLSRRSSKFLLRGTPNPRDFPNDVVYHTFEVEKVGLSTDRARFHSLGICSASRILNAILFSSLKVYLVNQDVDIDEEAYSFIRKRTTIDKNQKKRGSVYQITTVQRTSEGEVIEQKRYACLHRQLVLRPFLTQIASSLELLQHVSTKRHTNREICHGTLSFRNE